VIQREADGAGDADILGGVVEGDGAKMFVKTPLEFRNDELSSTSPPAAELFV
jgi:hypothetical protein